MASSDFKKLNRQMMIYRIVQTILTGLLIVLAIFFQSRLTALNKPEPVRLQYSGVDRRTVAADMAGLQAGLARCRCRDRRERSRPDRPSSWRALRKKRLIGDLWKFCGVAFFMAFVALVPGCEESRSGRYRYSPPRSSRFC